jgi:putative flippase GtrA
MRPDRGRTVRTPGAMRTRHAFAIGLIANFSLHVLTGFAAVAVHYGALYALLQLGLSPLVGSAIGFCGGALTRFTLSYWRVFSPSHGLTIAGRRFVVALAAQALANTALLALLLAAGLTVWPAQIATTVLLTFANYAVYRLWVFR